jgi:hypothetical protein
MITLLTFINVYIFVVYANGHELEEQGVPITSTEQTRLQSQESTDQQINVKFYHENQRDERERRDQDPSDHYFCGIGFADAAENCARPCPSGSTSE